MLGAQSSVWEDWKTTTKTKTRYCTYHRTWESALFELERLLWWSTRRRHLETEQRHHARCSDIPRDVCSREGRECRRLSSVWSSSPGSRNILLKIYLSHVVMTVDDQKQKQKQARTEK